MALLIVSAPLCSALSITSTSGSVIYVDSASNVTPNLLGGYVSFNVTNTGSAIADAWATIGNFTGAFVSLGVNENGLYHIGPMAAGASRTVFFYVNVNCSSFQQGKCNIAAAQGFLVSLYSGRPTSNLLGSQSFSVTVLDTTAASANKVTSVVASSNNPVLGTIVTVTTTGNTGTIGSSNIFYYSPATYFDWQASSFRLFSTSITFALTNQTINNQLLVPAASIPASASDYTEVATYLVQGSTLTPTPVSPVAFIGSGTQIKHTDTSKFAASFPPVGSTGNLLTLSKLSSASLLPTGGTTTYTLRVTNTNSSSAVMDDFVDTLPNTPAAVSYVAGSSKFAGSSIPDPVISGRSLTWTGVFNIPANGTADLTFTASVPNTVGTYVNSAVGHVGSTQIDTTATTTDNSPATVSLTVGGFPVNGTVYLDANHNGVLDSGESWTSGVSVFVNLVSSGAVIQSVTVPAGAGNFSFSSVPAGTYSIVLTNSATAIVAATPSGFAFVAPSDGQLQLTVSNASVNNENFGLFKGSLVNGNVFKDSGTAVAGTANNGVLDSGETGVSGVSVRATDGGGTTYDTAQTASDGSYTLFIAPGATTVTVIKTNPAKYISTGAQAGTTGGSYNRSTDTLTFTKAGEGVFTGINLGIVPVNSFAADQSQQGLPSSVLFYPHLFTPGTAGQLSFSLAAVSSPAAVNFTHVLYQDTNCNGLIDAGEPVINGPVTITVGTNFCLVMKEIIPDGAPFNATDSVVITASFTYTNAVPALAATYTVRDLTTVGSPANAGLRLEKNVDKTTALPGTNLTYTVIFTNDSSAPLSNLKINDSTPAFTTFVSATCPGTLPNNLTSCSITAPVAGATGNIQWTFAGTLGPSQTGTVVFVVKIQ
jgi:uncharacterized repeat protein (TIGR01451 family)